MDKGMSDWSRFERLTPFRVRDVLLVASHFDHYLLEESGYLAEIMRQEYSDLNLSQSPRIIHSPEARDALLLLQSRDFDVVITMARVGDMDVNAFGIEAKRIRPGMPVMMLSHNTRELATLSADEGIDRIFVWTGDSRILLSICKLIEDERNVENDVRDGDVQVILLVEDSRRFYSAYLPLLYTQLVNQTTRLMGEGGNLHEKLLRLRARAKILLASDMESAKSIINRYQKNLIGVFTDGRFPNEGGDRDTAGLELVRYAQQGHRYLPILFQSKNLELREEAEALGVRFLHKEDSQLYQGIEDFMVEEMNFGDFVFRMPDGEEIGRASNLKELTGGIDSAPLESIEHHARRNQFSHWLRTRTEFSLAARMRPMTIDDFGTPEGVRKYLTDLLREHIEQVRMRTIRDFDSSAGGVGFQRIGRGSLGGKGRGLAFFFTRMPDLGLGKSHPEVEFVIPRSIVVATDIFEDFLGDNELARFAYEDHDDETVDSAFLQAEFRSDVVDEFSEIIENADWPLAVRSSSLLEDSSHQPFSGVYSTYMLANDHPEFEVRLRRLLEAVKLVYASTYHRAAKGYVTATPSTIEDERMAVVIQELIGDEVNGRFYPMISGAARSHNHYPVEPLLSEDGIAAICIGLGRQVATGGKCLRYSPAQPRRIHQFHNNQSTLDTSQRSFFAIPMRQEGGSVYPSEEDNLLNLGLEEAEEDGCLTLVGSTYITSDDRIVDSVKVEGGPRIVTFAPVLKHGRFPLSEILHRVLTSCENYIGSPVEIEFAVSIDSSGSKRFAILQVRPMMDESVDIDVDLEDVDKDKAICTCSQSLGNGVIEDVRDVVYVHPERLDRLQTSDLTSDIEAIDAALREEERPYVLIGPGRWGSSDPSLGIPVQWEQIMGSRAIVEVPMADIHVEPSQGTHFFQNIITFNIGYLTIGPNDYLDWDWLDSFKPATEFGPLRHVRLEHPLKVILDSRDSEAIITK
ncbi:MAG: PEP/pyruvate-binding domain-containing protein [Candidatus Thalassarchaeum sp.]